MPDEIKKLLDDLNRESEEFEGNPKEPDESESPKPKEGEDGEKPAEGEVSESEKEGEGEKEGEEEAEEGEGEKEGEGEEQEEEAPPEKPAPQVIRPKEFFEGQEKRIKTVVEAVETRVNTAQARFTELDKKLKEDILSAEEHVELVNLGQNIKTDREELAHLKGIESRAKGIENDFSEFCRENTDLKNCLPAYNLLRLRGSFGTILPSVGASQAEVDFFRKLRGRMVREAQALLNGGKDPSTKPKKAAPKSEADAGPGANAGSRRPSVTLSNKPKPQTLSKEDEADLVDMPYLRKGLSHGRKR